MSTIAAALRPVPIPRRDALTRDPAAQAFMLLRIVFTVAPILFGLDKFTEMLTDDWTRYLASEFNDIIPGSAADAMASGQAGAPVLKSRTTPPCQLERPLGVSGTRPAPQ